MKVKGECRHLHGANVIGLVFSKQLTETATPCEMVLYNLLIVKISFMEAWDSVPKLSHAILIRSVDMWRYFTLHKDAINSPVLW